MAEQLSKRNIIIVAGIIVLIVLANIIGSRIQTTSEQHIVESFFPPGQYTFQKENDNKWIIYDSSRDESGYLYMGEGKGYNGMVGVLARTDIYGHIVGLDLARHSETPSYVDRIISNNLKSYPVKNDRLLFSH